MQIDSGFFVYFIVSAIIIFLSLISLLKSQKKYAQPLLIFNLILILLLNGTRDHVGTDYSNYVSLYNFISRGIRPNLELGYWAINYIFKDFENGYRYVFFTSALITYSLLFWVFKKEGTNPYSVIFLVGFGFLFFTNNIIRQGIAISIFYYSIQYIYKRKLYKYIIAIVITSLFHTSAFLLLPIYWIAKIKIKPTYWYLIIFFSLMLGILNIEASIFFKIASMFPKYNSLLHHFDTSSKIISTSNIILLVLSILVLSSYKYIETDKRSTVYLNLFLIGTSLSLIVFRSFYLMRFTFYFFYVAVILIPLILKRIPSKNNRQIYFILFLVFSLIWWFKTLYFNDNDCLPYNSFIFN